MKFPPINLWSMYKQARDYVKPQPGPAASQGPAVWDLVMQDMSIRDADGMHKYGTRLKPNNGRDMLIDAYQEALDLCVYLRGALYERDGK